MTKPKPSTSRNLALIAVALVMAAAVLWLNFGRSDTRPPDEALEAARAAAAEMAQDEPVPDPAAPPPVASPARPTPLGGR